MTLPPHRSSIRQLRRMPCNWGLGLKNKIYENMPVCKANALLHWEKSLSFILKSAWRSQKTDWTGAIFEDFEVRTVKLRQVARSLFLAVLWRLGYLRLASSPHRARSLSFCLLVNFRENWTVKLMDSYKDFYSAKVNVCRNSRELIGLILLSISRQTHEFILNLSDTSTNKSEQFDNSLS